MNRGRSRQRTKTSSWPNFITTIIITTITMVGADMMSPASSWCLADTDTGITITTTIITTASIAATIEVARLAT